MKILVTGREGQVARSLAERGARQNDIELIFAARPAVDLMHAGSLTDAIRSAAPDIVVNAAAYTAVDKAESEPVAAFRVNGEAAGEAATAAAAVGAPIIHLSTDYVFDGAADTPYREDDPTAPINVYGKSKLAGEAAVRAAAGRHAILRTSWVVSPFGSNFVRTMLRLAAERDELRVVADQSGRPSNALDLADAVLIVARRLHENLPDTPGGTFHLAGSGSCHWAELAEAVMQASASSGGPSARIVPIPTSDYPTPAARPAYSVMDTRKFEEAFSHRLPEWPDSIARLTRRLVAGEAEA